jgi:hypothetical protein
VPVHQLLREIRERGYPGSSKLLVRYINQGRLDTERPHIAPRMEMLKRQMFGRAGFELLRHRILLG